MFTKHASRSSQLCKNQKRETPICRFLVKQNSKCTTDCAAGGYPALGQFLGGDERWMMFRRFSRIQARLILEKQDEMRILEERLHDMDLDDLSKEPREPNRPRRRLFTRHRQDKDEAAARQLLMGDLERTYLEYERLLSAAHRLNTMNKPAPYEWKSVKKYIERTKPIVQRESDYIKLYPDLVSLRGASEHAHLSAFVERVFNQIKSWRNPNIKQQDRNKETGIWSVKHMEKKDPMDDSSNKEKFSLSEWQKGNSLAEKWARMLVSTMLLLLVPVFFVIPIYALTRIGNNIGNSIGVLVAFALSFTVVLQSVTSAGHHEVLGITAA
jgi:hypothetical protein